MNVDDALHATMSAESHEVLRTEVGRLKLKLFEYELNRRELHFLLTHSSAREAQLARELGKVKQQLLFAVGMVSTMPQFVGQPPETVLKTIEDQNK